MKLLLKNILGEIVGEYSEGVSILLPNGDHMSPAYAGWSNETYNLEEAPASIPPTPEEILAAARAGMTLSFAQLLIGLVGEAWITEDEGDAWADGVLPIAVTSLIATLPQDQQFAARTRAKKATEILRVDPLVELLGSTQGKTAEELDQFFTNYANV